METNLYIQKTQAIQQYSVGKEELKWSQRKKLI